MPMRVAMLAVTVAFAAGDVLAQEFKTDQLVTYYRKKNNVPPTAQVSVSGIKDSPIKGAKEGVLDVAGPQPKKVPFTASADGKYVVFAEAVDVSVDPSKAVMAKIKLDGASCKGPKDAKVTIVEWSDYQCPFCAKGYNTLEQQVLKEFGDKVRFCFKDFPLAFHPWAEPASMAAKCIEQQKPAAFWKVYDGFFQNQKEVNVENVKEKAWGFVEAEKLDRAKFDDCFDNKKTQAAVRAEMAEGQSIGITGTPSFAINGRLLVGAQPFEQFKAVIEDELASAG
jgi:protein-disulfide isomerase